MDIECAGLVMGIKLVVAVPEMVVVCPTDVGGVNAQE